MSRITRRITRPPQNPTYEDKVFVKCNFCGVEAVRYLFEGDAPEWPARESYEMNATAIWMKTGHSYPDDSMGLYRELHVCVSCFEEKVIPALEGLGVKFDEIKYHN